MIRGLIDIHTHIIPGVDDGAQSHDDTTGMLIQYKELGFETAIATPHLAVTSLPDYREELLQGFRFTEALARSHDMALLNGKEIRLTPDIRASQTELASFALAGTSHVLVDFPSGSWPYYAEEALFQVQTLGFTPILAHPERYGWGVNEKHTPGELVARGVLLQVTLGSLTGGFGKSARANSVGLLKEGLVHFVATDAHGPGGRLKSAERGMAWLKENHGEVALKHLLFDMPLQLLSAGQIVPYQPRNRKKGWQGFFASSPLSSGTRDRLQK